MRSLNNLRRLIDPRYRQIKSPLACLSALQGNHISVMPGSSIDKPSSLGDYTYIGYNCFITKAVIGRYVSIANNVSIGMGEHKLDKIFTSSLFYDQPYEMLTEKDCIIGNDVWVGVDSIIRRGVKVGDGAIIGANSFVNKDVPDFAIVVGSPARIIGYRFESAVAEKIKASLWWNYDLAEAKKIINDLQPEVSAK